MSREDDGAGRIGRSGLLASIRNRVDASRLSEKEVDRIHATALKNRDSNERGATARRQQERVKGALEVARRMVDAFRAQETEVERIEERAIGNRDTLDRASVVRQEAERRKADTASARARASIAQAADDVEFRARNLASDIEFKAQQEIDRVKGITQQESDEIRTRATIGANDIREAALESATRIRTTATEDADRVRRQSRDESNDIRQRARDITRDISSRARSISSGSDPSAINRFLERTIFRLQRILFSIGRLAAELAVVIAIMAVVTLAVNAWGTAVDLLSVGLLGLAGIVTFVYTKAIEQAARATSLTTKELQLGQQALLRLGYLYEEAGMIIEKATDAIDQARVDPTDDANIFLESIGINLQEVERRGQSAFSTLEDILQAVRDLPEAARFERLEAIFGDADVASALVAAGSSFRDDIERAANEIRVLNDTELREINQLGGEVLAFLGTLYSDVRSFFTDNIDAARAIVDLAQRELRPVLQGLLDYFANRVRDFSQNPDQFVEGFRSVVNTIKEVLLTLYKALKFVADTFQRLNLSATQVTNIILVLVAISGLSQVLRPLVTILGYLHLGLLNFTSSLGRLFATVTGVAIAGAGAAAVAPSVGIDTSFVVSAVTSILGVLGLSYLLRLGARGLESVFTSVASRVAVRLGLASAGAASAGATLAGISVSSIAPIVAGVVAALGLGYLLYTSVQRAQQDNEAGVVRRQRGETEATYQRRIVRETEAAIVVQTALIQAGRDAVAAYEESTVATQKASEAIENAARVADDAEGLGVPSTDLRNLIQVAMQAAETAEQAGEAARAVATDPRAEARESGTEVSRQAVQKLNEAIGNLTTAVDSATIIVEDADREARALEIKRQQLDRIAAEGEERAIEIRTRYIRTLNEEANAIELAERASQPLGDHVRRLGLTAEYIENLIQRITTPVSEQDRNTALKSVRDLQTLTGASFQEIVAFFREFSTFARDETERGFGSLQEFQRNQQRSEELFTNMEEALRTLNQIDFITRETENQRVFISQTELLIALEEKYGESIDVVNQKLDEYLNKYHDTATQIRRVSVSQAEFAQVGLDAIGSLTSGLSDVILRVEDVGDAFKNVFQNIIRSVIQSVVNTTLSGVIRRLEEIRQGISEEEIAARTRDQLESPIGAAPDVVAITAATTAQAAAATAERASTAAAATATSAAVSINTTVVAANTLVGAMTQVSTACTAAATVAQAAATAAQAAAAAAAAATASSAPQQGAAQALQLSNIAVTLSGGGGADTSAGGPNLGAPKPVVPPEGGDTYNVTAYALGSASPADMERAAYAGTRRGAAENQRDPYARANTQRIAEGR